MSARILIVEDEALVAMELGMVLEDLGHMIVAFATDSRMALAEAERHKVDLALVDMHLSDGPTGGALGRALARMGVDVLFVTGNPDMVDVYEERAVGVLAKPTDDAAVSGAVQYCLARREGVSLSPPAQLQLLS